MACRHGQTGKGRCIKMILTDGDDAAYFCWKYTIFFGQLHSQHTLIGVCHDDAGKQQIEGLEYRHLPNVGPDMPAGFKAGSSPCSKLGLRCIYQADSFRSVQNEHQCRMKAFYVHQPFATDAGLTPGPEMTVAARAAHSNHLCTWASVKMHGNAHHIF